MAPLVVVLFSVFSPTDEVWNHLVDTVLMDLVINTVWLGRWCGDWDFFLRGNAGLDYGNLRFSWTKIL